MALAAAPAPGQAPPRAEFVTLGTGGGPLIRVERSEPANALVVGSAVYLFDVGDGVQRQMAAAKLPLANVRAVFVSHHHIDHNADLGPLVVTRWLLNNHAPMPVIGPPGTRQMVEGLAAAFRPTELAPITIGGPAKPPVAQSVAPRDMGDFTRPTIIFQDANVRVLAMLNDHYHFEAGSEAARFSRSYSFRIETGGQSIVYTGDTGWSDGLISLARDADLLVTEVIDLKAMDAVLKRQGNLAREAIGPMLAHMEQDHLTPDQVGRLAAAARVKKVVLTHLAPGLDDEASASAYVEGISHHYRGPVLVAEDLDRF